MHRPHARSWAESSPPLAAWAAGLASLGVVAFLSGDRPWSASTWARWDSGHYESIARDGYTLTRCAAEGGWCGNAGFFPGYPLLVGALHLAGLPVPGAAVVVSWLLGAAALTLLWHTFLRGLPRLAAGGGLAYAAWAPGQIYEYGAYPLSLLSLATVAWLRFLRDGRWLAAGLASAAAVLAYPVGVVLPLAATVWLALVLDRGRRLRAIAFAAVPSATALAAFAAVQRIQTGRWTAYLDAKAGYRTGVHDPLGMAWNTVLLLTRSAEPLSLVNATAWQAVVVVAVLTSVLVWGILRRRELTQFDLLLALWAAATWVLPMTQAHVSTWRTEAALAPLAILVARLPRPLLFAAVAAAAAVSVPIAYLFFAGRLV